MDDIDVVELKEEQAYRRTFSVKETFTRVFQHCCGDVVAKMFGDCWEEEKTHYTDSEFELKVAKLNEMADRSVQNYNN